jgi:oligopeptide/dipeptide ABC transporter ATP-binding protein
MPCATGSIRNISSENRHVLLQIKDLHVAYSVGGQAIRAVDGVNLNVRAGKVLAIVGESGSGKSTLAQALIRLIDPPGEIARGAIYFQGENLLALRERRMRALRGVAIALVMQNPGTALNPLMTVGHHFLETFHQHRSLDRNEAIEKTMETLRSVDLPDQADMMRRYPPQLSGGMRQRVLIGLAMLHRPALLVADEPTSALDVSTQAQILRLFRALNQRFGTTTILITHNLGVAAEIGDDIAVMYAGKLVEVGSVEEVFAAPAHPYTQSLLRSVPRISDIAFPLPIPGELAPRKELDDICVFQPRCEHALAICGEREPPGFMIGDRTVYCFLCKDGLPA